MKNLETPQKQPDSEVVRQRKLDDISAIKIEIQATEKALKEGKSRDYVMKRSQKFEHHQNDLQRGKTYQQRHEEIDDRLGRLQNLLSKKRPWIILSPSMLALDLEK